jgi:hypothetical protein
MSAERQFPSIEDVQSVDWEAAVADVDLATCHKLSSVFFQRSRECLDEGKTVDWAVFRFLGQLTFMGLNPDSVDKPLQPGLVATTGRSSDIDDLDDDALAVVESLLRTTVPAIRARCGDILWLRRKDHRAASEAASAYLEEYRTLDAAGQWVWGIQGLSRGMNLARILGSKKPLFETYTDFIRRRVDELKDSCADAYCLRLIDLLIDHRIGDPADLAVIAEAIGARLNGGGSDSLGRQYLDQAITCYEWAKDGENTRRVKCVKGDSLVALAEETAAKQGHGYSSAAHHLAIGIECLRQGREDPERVKELHKTLLDLQIKSRDEMQTHSHETNISELVESARQRVAGLSLNDAVFAMALGHGSINVEALRDRVIKQADEFPLASLFAVTMIASDGRVVGHKPSMIHSTGAQQEAAIEAEMFHQATLIDWGLRAQAYIDVCRRQISDEHRPSYKDLQFLVLQNPFVPPGHEALYLKGIVCGFRGEFDYAAHLLVPQIEESIRHVLKCAGHVTSKLDAKLIQQERSLGTLLEMPETIEVFGKNHVFELRGILCADFGFGLRNRLAHGFLTYNESWGIDVVNLWWLVIRLLCMPHVSASDGEETVRQE